jgi:hypothetical protein
MLQTAEDLQAAAHFNNTFEFVIDKFGPLFNDKMTGEICVLTSWRRFDECSAARTNVVFTNSYVDDNSCLISE